MYYPFRSKAIIELNTEHVLNTLDFALQLFFFHVFWFTNNPVECSGAQFKETLQLE